MNSRTEGTAGSRAAIGGRTLQRIVEDEGGVAVVSRRTGIHATLIHRFLRGAGDLSQASWEGIHLAYPDVDFVASLALRRRRTA